MTSNPPFSGTTMAFWVVGIDISHRERTGVNRRRGHVIIYFHEGFVWNIGHSDVVYIL